MSERGGEPHFTVGIFFYACVLVIGEPQIELISYALISEQKHAAALLREELIAALAQARAADAPAVRERQTSSSCLLVNGGDCYRYPREACSCNEEERP
jgi:hypothetical protein